mmetsp:Transcript_33658/g.81529  ORF Transcript_33658/g.81529 Transcript_33658/m.81529 type:complete len:231 (-) Transcript_33658:186-878(-)
MDLGCSMAMLASVPSRGWEWYNGDIFCMRSLNKTKVSASMLSGALSQSPGGIWLNVRVSARMRASESSFVSSSAVDEEIAVILSASNLTPNRQTASNSFIPCLYPSAPQVLHHTKRMRLKICFARLDLKYCKSWYVLATSFSIILFNSASFCPPDDDDVSLDSVPVVEVLFLVSSEPAPIVSTVFQYFLRSLTRVSKSLCIANSEASILERPKYQRIDLGRESLMLIGTS